MNRKYIVLILIIVFLTIIIAKIFISKKDIEKSVTNNDTDIYYNEETSTYTVYDENNEVIYNGNDKITAEFYNRDPDYNPKMPEF